MKRNGEKFSYRPYVVYGKEKSVYIVRIAPSVDSVELQWLGEGEFTVRIFDGENEVKKQTVCENFVRIDGLESKKTYTVTVENEQGSSIKRLFTTGDYLGKVVNHLHTDDLAFENSGRYIASPSIVRFKDALYVSMDVFRGGDQKGKMNLSFLYRSTDEGKTWQYVTDLIPCFWGKLFVAQDKLCILANSGEFESLLVSCSEDGENWSTPTIIKHCDGASGFWVANTPTPFAYKDNKIYFALTQSERGRNGRELIYFTLDLSKEVTDYDAWSVSKPFVIEYEWNGDQTMHYAEEGNIVERDGELYALYRFASKRALMVKLNTEENCYEFYKVVDCDFGWCKFYITKVDDYYYAMGNTVCYPRSKIVLARSKNLEEWETIKTLEDISDLDPETNGVQYPSFVYEDGKFKTVLRIALNGAHTFHDSNAIVYKEYNID